MSDSPSSAPSSGCIFISFDGAKGVGKSTIINALGAQLSDLGLSVYLLVEKALDPNRDEISELIKRNTAQPAPHSEREITRRLAQSRSYIYDRHIRPLYDERAGNSTPVVIMIDRWFPSDVVFRSMLTVDELIYINREVGVAVPDLTFAVDCDPAISFDRAHMRSSGLRSHVIRSFQEHQESTIRFRSAAECYGWRVLTNEGPITETIDRAIQIIDEAIGKSVGPNRSGSQNLDASRS